MLSQIENAGARRLLIAAGVSAALHAAVVLSINRQPAAGDVLQPSRDTAAPLVARLVSAVTASVLSSPAEPASVLTPAAEPPPPPVTTAAAGTPGSAAAPGSVYYFKSSELDRRPFPLARIEVPPPESAAEAGAVMIRLRISERGRVEDARIMFGTGIAEFEAAALREFSRARFHPGYRSNVAVRSEMLIEVKLHPPQSAASPAAAEPAPALAPAE